MKIDRRGKFVSMVGYISKYLSYTQSCVGCIGRLVYSSKTSLWGSPEYTEGSMRHCFNGLQRTYYSIDHSVVLHASTTGVYRRVYALLSQWITENLLLNRSFCRSTRFDYWSIQKGVCVTVSMDYRELTTQSIILSFYTLRLPFKSCDEIVLASICGSRNEYGAIE
jgi:hypothetical protein